MVASFLILYLAWINMITGYVYWLDYRFRSGSGAGEVPEGIFLMLGFLGGVFGIASMRGLLHHSIFRSKFRQHPKLYIASHVGVASCILTIAGAAAAGV